jgi:hypothetical protein
MMTIRHYPLHTAGLNVIEMPIGAELLDATQENNLIHVRAMIDTEVQDEWRRFEVVADGQSPVFESGRRFVGDVQIRSVAFHVFEVKKVCKPPTAPGGEQRTEDVGSGPLCRKEE